MPDTHVQLLTRSAVVSAAAADQCRARVAGFPGRSATRQWCPARTARGSRA
jgi:hypothetical protein